MPDPDRRSVPVQEIEHFGAAVGSKADSATNCSASLM